MAFTKFKTKDLARSATLKSRRRRIVFLSTSKPQSFEGRHRRPSIKKKHPLSTIAEPKESPQMDSKTKYISFAQESQSKSKNQSPKPLKKTRPEINLIKQERETSETSESSNSSTKPPSIFDHDEVNGKPGPVDTPPSSPASETAPDSEKKKQPKRQESKTTTAADAKQKKRPVEQAKSIQPQSSSNADSARPQASISRKEPERPVTTAGKPLPEKKTEMAFQRKEFLKNLDRSWPNTEVGGKGMFNPGNYCYRRAVVQCLLNIPIFVNWLSEHHTEGGNECPGTFEESTKGKIEKKKAPACLACALIRLARAYWQPEDGQRLLQATRRFDQTMHKLALNTIYFPGGVSKQERKEEVNGGQQDAAEFFRWILQVLDEHGQMQRQEIDSIFQHSIRKEKQCPACKHRTASEDINNHWLLTITQSKDSLESMIARTLRVEELPQMSCDNDKCKYNDKQKQRLDMSRRTTGIIQCPEILVVQINRAGYRKITSTSYKLGHAVAYPPVLDLTSRLDPQSTETTAKYSLSGVVSHRGNDLNSGHYLADSITPKGVRHITDSDVSRGNLSSLLKSKGFLKGDALTPYLLFYTRLHDGEQSPLSQVGGGNNAPGNTKKTPTKKTPPTITPTKSSKAKSSAGKLDKKRKASDSPAPTPTSSSKKQKNSQKSGKS